MTTESLSKWQQVEALYSEGATDVEICKLLGVTQGTFDKQYNEVPAFAALVDKGRTLSKAWWYSMARRNVFNKEFNTSLYNFAMKNLHGWADKVDTKSSSTENESYDKLRSEFNTILARFAKDNPEFLRTLSAQAAASGS